MSATYLGENAVVVGSGIGGLLAARALADFFKTVTVIECDTIDEANILKARPGVPQAYQTHALSSRLGSRPNEHSFDDKRAFFSLLPELEPTLLNNGSNRGDMFQDRYCYMEGWKPQFKSGVWGYFQTRYLLEGTIRTLLKNYQNIHFLYGYEVIGLLSDIKQKKLTGVRTIAMSNKSEKNIYADVIVDASGARSHFSDWLENIDLGKPKVTDLDVDITYITQMLKLSKPYSPKMTYIMGMPPNRKSAIMIQVEGGLASFSCSAHHGFKIDTTFAGILEFVKSLDQPDFYELIRDATPVGQVYVYKFPKIIRRYYETMQEIPKGLIVIGDAFATVDPYYGQGMGCAALEATALHAVLEKSTNDNYVQMIQNQYVKAASKIIDKSWTLNRSSEAIYFEKSPFTKMLEWYKNRVILLSNTDKTIWIMMGKIISMAEPPQIIFQPSVVYKVFKSLIFK